LYGHRRTVFEKGSAEENIWTGEEPKNIGRLKKTA
jgi:hypothetical protein